MPNSREKKESDCLTYLTILFSIEFRLVFFLAFCYTESEKLKNSIKNSICSVFHYNSITFLFYNRIINKQGV